ncbi:MAG: catecholate siderophore receptor [Chthoniobacter sp.]|nr:catecholate siderophore receptor [Chthoniobacter sp.]
MPQTITVVPETVIREQGATTLRDVLRNVPGISIQAGEGGVHRARPLELPPGASRGPGRGERGHHPDPLLATRLSGAGSASGLVAGVNGWSP